MTFQKYLSFRLMLLLRVCLQRFASVKKHINRNVRPTATFKVKKEREVGWGCAQGVYIFYQ